LLNESGVARSTLYKHFDDRSAVLVEAMKSPFVLLATAAATGQVTEALTGLFEHFWAQRRGAAEVLASAHVNRLARGLCVELRTNLSGLGHPDALRIAHHQLTILRLWVEGETPCSPKEMADIFAKSCFAMVTAAQSKSASV
jgi:AcrR family transcriptional regulator